MTRESDALARTDAPRDDSESEIDEPVTFLSPPVNEVALSVQFEGTAIDEFDVLAKYWPAIRADFPNHDKQPPLLPIGEDFDRPPRQGVQLGMFTAPPVPRYWFISADKTSLVQVQADRFSLNWRQTTATDAYPRYRQLRPEFESRFGAFLEVVGDVPATWCELTYINHVKAPITPDGAHGPLAKVLRALDPRPVSSTLPPVEDTQLQQRFVIQRTEAEGPVGRLYLAATPAFSQDGHPLYVITLLARGKPRDGTLPEILAFFDLARSLIVRGFKESTTDEMHRIWGLEEQGGH
jgi:uncharacterized protein (TIGR04255 family)